MSVSLNMNVVNQISKEEVIYQKDEPLKSICLILKGRVVVETEGVKTVFSSGNFLGILDIEKGAHSFTYTAYDNVVLYAFSVTSFEQVDVILNKKPEYRGLLNTSLNYFISELNGIHNKLKQECKTLREFVLEQYSLYQLTGNKTGILAEQVSSIDLLKKKTMGDVSLCPDIPYYIECAHMGVDAQKNYYMGSSLVSKRHFDEQRNCIYSLISACKMYATELYRSFRVLILDEKNIFQLSARMLLQAKHVGGDGKELATSIDKMVEVINDSELFLVKKAGIKVEIDRDRMEKIYYAIISGEEFEENMEQVNQVDVSAYDGSLNQLMDYAPIDNDVKEEFVALVEEFIARDDKFSRENEATANRKGIAKYFYNIYEAIFLKSLDDINPPQVVQLFLNYGYVSEKLLSRELLGKLTGLTNHEDMKEPCKVYTLPQWLKAIYKKEKDPSRNEFDMGFDEYLKHEVSMGSMDAKKIKRLLEDPAERVHYEIQNLFAYANRLVNGKVSIFIPIFCEAGLSTRLENGYLTTDKLNTVANKYRQIDPSIFYRPYLESYAKAGITKMEVFEEVVPDIILFPTCGANAMMWQESAGRNRRTKGRFLFPIVLESELDKEMVKVFAHFRWEICRSEQGAYWNNFHYPSLTSEYTDYLQFYRKNNDLSPEGKQKVKALLTSCNNRHRDVFARDYADWMFRESLGAMKVNKIVRRILFKYCPFAANIRKKLFEQTVYQDAAKQYLIEFRKKQRETMINYQKFEKENLTIPKEVEVTRDYYQNV